MRGMAMALIVLGSSGAAAQPDKASDHLLMCSSSPDEKTCKASQVDFTKWHRLAWRGDYQGQRNVAFYFGRDTDGAVRRNPLLACAWRLVILTSGSLQLVDGDTSNVRIDCGKLDDIQRHAAAAQAARIEQGIRRGGR